MENELIQKILAGNTGLFEDLVKKYQNLVFTICLKITRDRHDAENAAQETFLSAYLSLASYRGPSLKPWLCRIAVHKSIDCKRGRDHALRHEDRFESAEEKADGFGVEEWLVARERREKLDRVLAEIPDRYASVLKDRYYQCLPVKEIARRRGAPEKTVETQLYRAKKLVRERWGDDGDG